VARSFRLEVGVRELPGRHAKLEYLRIEARKSLISLVEALDLGRVPRSLDRGLPTSEFWNRQRVAPYGSAVATD
jgi:hypothetical protein